MTEKEKIYEIALVSRNELEKFAIKNNKIGNPVTLECYCAIGAYTLNKILKSCKFKTQFITGTYYDDIADNVCYHCWVEINEHIVDITATQFSGITNRVHMISKENKLYKKELQGHWATRFINSDWIEAQRIKTNETDIKEMVKVVVKSAKKLILT